MKKVIKIYRTTNGDFQIRIPRYMAQELNLGKETHLDIENKTENEIVLKKLKKSQKKC